MMPVSLESLRAAAGSRPVGYVHDVLSRGSVRDGFVWLTPADYEFLRLKYSPAGLGDQVARLAKPIARVLDATLGTNLASCPSCADRQAALNHLFPSK